MLLFFGFDSGSRWVGTDRWFPFWLLVPLFSLLILPDAGLYSSYRHRSLRVLIRRVTTSWLLLLSLLLTAAFLSKSLESFSRLDGSLWAFSGWLWLLLNQVLLRKWGCDGIELMVGTPARSCTGDARCSSSFCWSNC